MQVAEEFDFDYTDGDVQIYNTLSPMTHDFKTNLYVPSPLEMMHTVTESFKMLTESVTVLDEKNFLTPNDMPVDPRLEEVQKEVEKILNYEYLAQPVREKQGEISKALAAPLIGFLKKEVGKIDHNMNVLVVGAGVGKDILRVKSSFHGETLRFVCVEPNRKLYVKLRKLFPEIEMENNTVSGAEEFIRQNGPYDAIIANMSIHYILAVASGRKVARMFADVLKPDGWLYGSYLDVPSIKAAGDGLHAKYGHSVLYLGEDRKTMHFGEIPTNGIARISVGGVVWRDPWLTTEQYYDIFTDTHMGVCVVDGTSMVYGHGHGPLYPTPQEGFEHLPKRAELNAYRALIATKMNLPCRGTFPYPVPKRMRDVPLDGLAMRHVSAQFNKGQLVGPNDLQYIRPGLCWVAEKWDGVPVKIIHSAKTLCVVCPDDKVIKFTGLTTGVDVDFILQAEMLTVENKKELIVLDVLVAPWGQSGNFLSRWRWLENMVKEYQTFPFRLQTWMQLDDPRVGSLIECCKEGIVLQSLTASSGALSKNLGSARYVKRVKTVDYEFGGQIWECDLNGNKLRVRKDKKTPNPPSVIEGIKKALSFDDFLLWFGLTLAPVRKECLRQVMDGLRKSKPIGEWSREMIVCLYAYSTDEWLELKVGPTVLLSYRMMMLDHLMKNSLIPEEPISDDNVPECDIQIEYD